MKVATQHFEVGSRSFRKGDEVAGSALRDVERVRPDLVEDKPEPRTKKDDA